MRPHAPTKRFYAGAVFLTVLLVSCAEPQIPVTSPTTTDTGAESLADVDPLGDALSVAIDELTATLEQISTVLATATAERAALMTAADTALDLLLFTENAVFPVARPGAERDATGNDGLSVVLNAARQKGGFRADMVTSALRDTLAGDLGAWERDPDGMRTQALTAYGPTVTDTTRQVAALDADGMRAIAWIAFARTQQSPAVIRDAFDAAQTHLAIVILSLQLANDA